MITKDNVLVCCELICLHGVDDVRTGTPEDDVISTTGANHVIILTTNDHIISTTRRDGER